MGAMFGGETITAREAVPGTRLVVPVSSIHGGGGWKYLTVREWRGCGNGYAELFSTDGMSVGQFTSDHEFELA